ncbi:MAG: CatB-related O-acetyltransferase [Alphaproteobacteria bacterium]|nr:CatB-related O-acetyltransferase [Alphaproteobacteria bacterium]
MEYVNPDVVYPIENWYRTCFLKNIITNPQIIVGDYTYYDDTEDVYNFEKNVLYLFDFIGDKLIIGKFCQISSGVCFIMNGANHAMSGISTYPFEVFGKSWSNTLSNDLNKGDTVIGNDVWIGNSATIMPGVKIGHGAIIGTNTLVTKDVAPYTIVGGNPGKLIRNRFDQQTIDFLLELAWWDWPIERITKHVKDIASRNLEILRAL